MHRPSPCRRFLRLLALLALGTGPVWAQTTINQFPLTDDIQPLDIATGPDGNLWYTVQGDGLTAGSARLGRITPAGVITEYILGDSSAPVGIVAGPDGKMWYTESGVPPDPAPPGTSAIGRIDVGTFPAGGSVTRFTAGLTAGATPFGICVGPDGALWFAEREAHAIGRITTSGTITEYPIGAPAATPLGIVAGPDGNLWFTDRGTTSSIGVMTTAGAIVKRVAVPTAGSNPTGITVGPDGRLWYVAFTGNKVGVLATTATSASDVTEYATPTAAPYRVVTGPDGALWFTENGGGPAGHIGRITTAGTLTEYTTAGLGGPYGIALGPDAALWFTERDNSPTKIGQLIVDCPGSASVGGPQTICAGGTTAGLGGNTPPAGTGAWSVVSGGTGTFSPDVSTPNATFTHTGGAGPVIVGWTITNPACPPSAAIVMVTINQPPTAASAGGPQTICALGTTTGLGGNAPTTGTGAWSVVSGGTGTFSPGAGTPNATFTHTGGAGPVLLAWTITNGTCAPSVANVTVTVRTPPTTASAGGPQTICNLGSSQPLGGNTPAVGVGTWTVVSGGTGTFSPNAATPNATFTHTGGAGPIVLAWTIANAPCAPSTANVTLTVGASCGLGSLAFYPVTPCRRIDTRLAANAPQLAAGEERTFVLTGAPCSVPSTARAVAVNVTVTGSSAAGDLKAFATGLSLPTATIINFGAGQTRANNGLLALDTDGSGRVEIKNDAAGTVHVIIDVNGYFK